MGRGLLSLLGDPWFHGHPCDFQGKTQSKKKGRSCAEVMSPESKREKAGKSLQILQVALLLTCASLWGGEWHPEQEVTSVPLTCLDPTFVTLSGCVVSSYQLSINRPNTHFNSEYGEAHLFADRSQTCKLTKCRVPCLLIMILKICAVTN